MSSEFITPAPFHPAELCFSWYLHKHHALPASFLLESHVAPSYPAAEPKFWILQSLVRARDPHIGSHTLPPSRNTADFPRNAAYKLVFGSEQWDLLRLQGLINFILLTFTGITAISKNNESMKLVLHIYIVWHSSLEEHPYSSCKPRFGMLPGRKNNRHLHFSSIITFNWFSQNIIFKIKTHKK